jgi:hypothetical protein
MITDTGGGEPRREGPALYGIRSDHDAYLRERERRMVMYARALSWHIVHRLDEGLHRDEAAA